MGMAQPELPQHATDAALMKLVRWILALLIGGVNMPSYAQQPPWLDLFAAHQGEPIDYRVLYPQDYQPEKRYPLIFFLHGAGERGEDNQAQLTHGADLFVQHRADTQAIVVFPQVRTDDYWVNANINRQSDPFEFKYLFDGQHPVTPTPAMAGLLTLVDSMISRKDVDPTRVYVMGLSMGGMGTLEIVARRPHTFAAAIAICGGARTDIVELYRQSLPIRLYHGEQDRVVIPQFSKDLYAALRARGMDVSLTLYPDIGHDSWHNAFAEPDLLSWLLSQQQSQMK